MNNVKIIKIPNILDRRGNLAHIENKGIIPFSVKNVFYLYDVPSGSKRGGHAHRKLQQLLIAVSGSFDVIINDGSTEETISLNRPNKGLLIPPMIWREMENFSNGSVCLVLASMKYDESDYFRDYKEYVENLK